MLKKLLKYDFKSIFKYWWIAAITSTALSALGGFCIKILRDANSDGAIQPPAVLTFSANLMLILSVVAIVAFSLLSLILVYVRLYKNFFTDEAYLTFTLPVKRSQLLNSKLISGTATQLATYFALFIDIGLMLVIGFADEIFQKEFWDGITLAIKEILKHVDIYTVIVLIEALVFVVLVSLFTILFTYVCITFASMITKKAKIITAIGIYYGANGILSFVIQMLTLFGSTSVIQLLSELPYKTLAPVVVLIGLTILLFVAIFVTLLYIFEHWMLDRKLNLA